MQKKEAKTCWDFWNCEVSRNCPEARYSSGKYCWELAGTGCAEPYCFLLKKEFRFCWECPWFKKMNPGFFKEQDSEADWGRQP